MTYLYINVFIWWIPFFNNEMPINEQFMEPFLIYSATRLLCHTCTVVCLPFNCQLLTSGDTMTRKHTFPYGMSYMTSTVHHQDPFSSSSMDATHFPWLVNTSHESWITCYSGYVGVGVRGAADRYDFPLTFKLALSQCIKQQNNQQTVNNKIIKKCPVKNYIATNTPPPPPN